MSFESQPDKSPSSAGSDSQGATLLVIDDEEGIRQITREYLEGHGFRVFEAGDGQAAFDILHQARNAIDLILLDLRMPGMSGERFIQTLNQLEAPPKVIVVSAHLDGETRRVLEGLGVSRFMKKPFNLQTLMQATKAVLAAR